MKTLITTLLLLAASIPAVEAQARIPGPGGAPAAAAGYVGPGDVISGAIAWWGLRCYNTAYTGNVADVFDSATGSTTETLLTCSAGGIINQTINTLATTCASGCKVKTLYDQSGANSCGSSGGSHCDFLASTNSVRAALTTSCLGSLNCMTFASASSQQMVNSLAQSMLAQTQPYTWSTVARQTTLHAGAIIADNNEEIYFSVTPQFFLNASGNSGTPTTVNTWYAAQGVINGASSVIYLNGTSNSVSTPGSNSTGASPILGSDPFSQFLNGNIAEVGLWHTAFSSGQQSSMNSNQRAYWGF